MLAAEVNQLSAPIKGNAGVFVLQVYGKDKLNETFDAKAEEATLTNMHARFASRLMNDLYLKANVKIHASCSSKQVASNRY